LRNIRHILEDLGVHYADSGHKHGRLGWVQVDCPWCGTGTDKFHLGISLETGASACWRCGKKNTAAVLAHYTGKSRSRMREILDTATLAPVPHRPTGTYTPPHGVCAMLPGHMAYLRGRGLDPHDMANLWGVRGTGRLGGEHRHLSWRLFIPITYHGAVVSWTTRSIKRVGQRYLSASMAEEAIPHKHILYGADYARHAIIVHEGPLDVWATGPGAVATCGIAVTDAQIMAMSRYTMRVVCFDNESEAQARARALCANLAMFPGETHNVVLETGADAAEADKAEIRELREAFLGG